MSVNKNYNAELWERRRVNLRTIMAHKNVTAKELSIGVNLSPNAVGNFLRGDSKTMDYDSLTAICNYLELITPLILDSENPFSDEKLRLYKLINSMSADQIRQELDRLSSGSS